MTPISRRVATGARVATPLAGVVSIEGARQVGLSVSALQALEMSFDSVPRYPLAALRASLTGGANNPGKWGSHPTSFNLRAKKARLETELTRHVPARSLPRPKGPTGVSPGNAATPPSFPRP